MKKYNILWLDDEFKDGGPAVTIKKKLEKWHKDLDFVTTWNASEFEDLLQQAPMHYDAVILDVMGYVDSNCVRTAKFASFNKALEALDKLKFSGPRVYLSGQPFLDDMNEYEQTLLSKKILKKDIITKTKLDDLIGFGNTLKEKIEETNTPEHQMRTKHPEACEIAAACSCENELFDILLQRKSIIDCTRGIRDIIESCFIPESERLNIMPRKIAINSLKVFEKGERAGIKLTPTGENLMHKTLAHAFSFVIDVCQDANHKRSDLSLEVNDYMKLYGGERILDASTNILVEVLTWLHRTKTQRNGEPFSKDEIYTISFPIQRAQVQQDCVNQAVFYIEVNSEKYMLGRDKNDPKKHKDLNGDVIKPGDYINLTELPSKSSKVTGYDKFVEIHTIVLAN